jgi:putative phosphoribosyl transferase
VPRSPPFPPTIVIKSADVSLGGDLTVPLEPAAVAIVLDGTATSRVNPRNRYVAASLAGAGFATLLFDPLAADEDEVSPPRDVARVAGRLDAALAWLRGRPELRGLPRAVIGSGPGAAAALMASAADHGAADAIVSLDGRPDLAGDVIESITTPVLLVIGARDEGDVVHHRSVVAHLAGPAGLRVIGSAGRLFDDIAVLDEALQHTVSWLRDVLGAPRISASAKVLWQG